MLICGWIGITLLKNQVPRIGKDAYAVNLVAQMLYVGMMNEEEFKLYEKEMKKDDGKGIEGGIKEIEENTSKLG
jgi:hypothetical protein